LIFKEKKQKCDEELDLTKIDEDIKVDGEIEEE